MAARLDIQGANVTRYKVESQIKYMLIRRVVRECTRRMANHFFQRLPTINLTPDENGHSRVIRPNKNELHSTPETYDESYFNDQYNSRVQSEGNIPRNGIGRRRE